MDRDMESAAKKSIFRAPAHIRYSRRSDFEPKLVSIGPYYLGRENLKEMEYLKFHCVSDLMKNQAVGRGDIDAVPIEPFMMWESRARSFYINLNFDPRIFVRMLVLDSCFIIRIIISFHQAVQENMGFLEVNIKEVRSDLLLLENQIPLFFIRVVYEWLFPPTHNSSFKTFLEPFICLDMPWRFNHDGMSNKAAHLLDLYWRCSSSPEMIEQLKNIGRDRFDQEQPSWAEIYIRNKPKVIANATVLHQIAGIKFKKLNDAGHHDGFDVGSRRVSMGNKPSLVQCLARFIPSKFPFRFTRMSDNQESNKSLIDGHQKLPSPFDVIFSNGIMRMPCLKIDSSQITLLLNLIAYENSMLPSMRTISSYMKLMDALIDSERDVELLQQCDVIYNKLSSHKKAATFFNDVDNFCLIDDSTDRFSDLYSNVQKYYHSRWNRRWASLEHNYFSSPWSGISVVAGVTLLILSALQTFFTIYGHYYTKH